MSAIANKVYDLVKELFPYNIIIKEHYVNYKGTRLFFDFFIKDLGVYIEVHGRQHFNFVKHFHETKDKFLNQKNRDNLKIEYVQEDEKFCLARFYDGEDLNRDIVLNRVLDALSAEDCYV
jgi:hypothetical protein